MLGFFLNFAYPGERYKELNSAWSKTFHSPSFCNDKLLPHMTIPCELCAWYLDEAASVKGTFVW